MNPVPIALAGLISALTLPLLLASQGNTPFGEQLLVGLTAMAMVNIAVCAIVLLRTR